MHLSRLRAGLLATAAFGVLGTALAMAPDAATATTCTPNPATSGPASGTQTCTGAGSGVGYVATGGDLTINLNNAPQNGFSGSSDDGGLRNITFNNGSVALGYSAAALTNSNTSNGSVVLLHGSGGNISFTSLPGGTISYTGGTTSNFALDVTSLGSGSGSITLTTGDKVSSTGGGGIRGWGSGAVVINALADVSSGASILASNTAFGIEGISFNGPVTINAGSATAPINISASLASISAQTDTGAENITAYGNFTSPIGGNVTGASSDPVNVTVNGNVSGGATAISGQFGSFNATGTVTINANGGTLSNITRTIPSIQNLPAVVAWNSGTGNSIVNLGDGETIVSPFAGVDASTSRGTVTITEGKNTSITAAKSTASTNALGLVSNLSGSSNLFLGLGIYGQSQQMPATATNTVSILTGSGDTITMTGDNTAGIAAVNKGGGKGGVSVTLADNNAITMNSGDTATGIAALVYNRSSQGTPFGGTGNVNVSLGSNDVITVNAGDGVGGNLNQSAGIYAASNGGDVNIAWTGTGGSISAAPTASGAYNNYGVFGLSSGTGNVTITTGKGTSISAANGVAIEAASSITSFTAGLGGGTGAITITNNGILTGIEGIYAQGGKSISIVNNGTVNGLILADPTPINGLVTTASIVNNGTWVVNNIINTSRPASGTTTTVSNPGTLIATGTSAVTDQSSFTNTGLIDLHGGNSAPGDSLTIAGAYIGGGKLSVDAALGTAASGSTCGALADCLKISSSSGVTQVIVNNTAAASAAGSNSGGILIVDGASHAGDFVLDPSQAGYFNGSIDAGFTGYSLNYANNQVRLVSSGASPLAATLPALTGAIQGNLTSSNPMPGRMAFLRDAATPQGGNDPATSVWVNSGWSLAHNFGTASISTSAGSATASASYRQLSYNVSAGADLAFTDALDDGDILILGGMAGLVGSDVTFNQNQYVTAHLSGVQLGAYASWLEDGWFADADVLANLMTLNYAQNGAALFKTKPSANAFGFNAEAGKRVVLGEAYYVEPIAALAYADASADDAVSGSSTVHFGSNDALRAGMGLRLGTDVRTKAAILDLSLSARGWSELQSRETTTLLVGAAALPLTASSVGSYAEFLASMKVMDTGSGFTGFLNAGVDVNDRYNQFTMSGGLRYTW